MNRMSIRGNNLVKMLMIGVLALFLAACGSGDDGATGPVGPAGSDGSPGPAGPAGPAQPSEITETMSAEITAVTVAEDGTTTLTFTMANDKGYPYIGLAENRIRFTFAQLIPADPITGEPSKWQSYINRVESAPTDPDKGPGTMDQIQATAERSGTLTDNQDGSYTYVFDVNPTNVSDPVAVTYNADYTHRVAFQISGGGYPTLNRTYDWQPSTGITEGITMREMVTEGTCNECHGNLAIHGGGRVDTAYCVTCHNPGSVDANSGNTVDMANMVHKIHMGANLPSVQDGGEYAIWGYRDSKHDYSGVHIPQDVRNCQSCHNEDNPETAEAVNWMNVPTIETCGSCHDDIDFATGAGHEAGPYTDNSECATCHRENALVSTFDAHVGVLATKAMLAESVTAVPEAIRIDQGTGDFEVDVRLTIAGEAVTALRDGTDTDTDFGAVLGKYKYGVDNGVVAVNWDSGSGFEYNHEEIAFNSCIPDGSGLFTCSASGWLDGISDTDIVTVTTVDLFLCVDERSGMMARCDSTDADARVVQADIPPTTAFFMGDGTATTDGYDKISADSDSCQSCHADPIYHHGATELLQCKTCHNATRLSYRTGQPGDLKHNVHRYHATLAAVNPLAPPVDGTYEVDYPGNISTCTACHTEDQVEIPVSVNARATVANIASGWGAAPIARYTSPTATVCASCHLDIPSGFVDPSLPGLIDPANGSISLETQAVIDHMVQNGAVFGATTFEAANKVESCSVCHAKGKDSGIDKVHQFK